MDLERIKNIGIGAAYQGAKVLNDFYGKLHCFNKKGPIDLVTKADIESEKQIIESIQSKYPDHEILAEESGLKKVRSSQYRWIIDPLDGTTNYAHQIPFFSISIAFEADGQTVVGLVLNPKSGELFSAIRGYGATLNGFGVNVSKNNLIADSLVVTGFPYNIRQIIKPAMTRFERCLGNTIGLRRLGSAALDLCFVACGRFDGFWEENLKPWDTAAGFLIAKEAGATITDFNGQPYSIKKNEILATNGNIHNEMISLLKI